MSPIHAKQQKNSRRDTPRCPDHGIHYPQQEETGYNKSCFSWDTLGKNTVNLTNDLVI